MFTEPDTISMFCLLVYMYFLFIPLCPYYVCSNTIMIIFDIFSMNGHHLAFYMTEHNYSVFCNQKQCSTNANLSGNLYGATYFFSSLASLARYLRHK